MPQTLKAILALFIFSFLVLSSQTRSNQAQMAMVQNTFALLANSAAVERLELVGSRDFDQATIDSTVLTSPSGLTLPEDFGPLSDKAGDDVDDFHGTAVTMHRSIDGDTLSFRAETTVQYVEEANPEQGIPTNVPTRYKKIDVEVYSLHNAFTDTVRLSTIVSCKSTCQ